MQDAPIPAATLVLARGRQLGPPELLMVERAADMAFAGGALVFPGGRIDEADTRVAKQLGLPDGGASVAAIRETLEETGIPVGLRPAPDASTARALQKALIDGADFEALIDGAGLRLDPSALTPFARWVPQFHAVRRFDTLFFLAEAPPGEWEPHVVERECRAAFWLTAQAALKREQDGEARLIFPTRRNLERLALHASVAAMHADAAAHPVEPVTPWVEEHDGEKFITIPAHLGYPVTREKLDGLWRG